MTAARLILSALASAALVAPAVASTRVVIDDELRRTPVARVIGLSGAGIEYESVRGERRSASAERTIGFLDPGEAIVPAPEAGWVDLVTGERLVGEPAELASDGESFAWRHRDFGVLRLALEDVVRIVPPVDSSASRALPAAPDEPMLADRVTLLNGDVLRGFVLSVGDEVVVELESGATSRAALDLVAEIRLANPRGSASGVTLWLADGSVVSAASVMELSGSRLEVELRDGAIATMAVSAVRAASFDAERVRALASMPPSDVQTPAERRWSPPPRLEPRPGSVAIAPLFAGDVVAPGPMAVRWSMPEGATLLGFTAELPESALPWGDCELVVREAGRELARERLWDGRRSVEIRVELSGGPLEIEIEAGNYGPVGDVVRLRAPLVLLAPQ